MIQTANGYLLCSRHAEAWQRGGNDVSMWPASPWEIEDGGGRCADCLDELREQHAANMANPKIAAAIRD